MLNPLRSGDHTIIHIPTGKFIYVVKKNRPLLIYQWKYIIQDNSNKMRLAPHRCGLYLAKSIPELIDTALPEWTQEEVVLLRAPQKILAKLLTTPYFKLMMYPDITGGKFIFDEDTADKMERQFAPYEHDFTVIKIS